MEQENIAPKKPIEDVFRMIRELGSAGAVVILAVYVIVVQGAIIQDVTKAITRLTVLVEIIARDRGVSFPPTLQ